MKEYETLRKEIEGKEKQIGGGGNKKEKRRMRSKERRRVRRGRKALKSFAIAGLLVTS